jgi:hypothetical protein
MSHHPLDMDLMADSFTNNLFMLVMGIEDGLSEATANEIRLCEDKVLLQCLIKTVLEDDSPTEPWLQARKLCEERLQQLD